MGTVVVKMKNEHYGTEHDMVNLLQYIAAEGSNWKKEIILKSGGKGVSSKPVKAARQMRAVQRIYGKESKRRMYHLVVSYPEGMKEKAAILHAAEKIADMLFENCQVFYGIHTSTENWHIHYAINAVSYTTGRKWHQSKNEFREMKEKICSLAEDSSPRVQKLI